MSSVTSVGSAPHFPITSQVAKPLQTQQSATPIVQPVARDSDGDNDGSVGKNIDVRV